MKIDIFELNYIKNNTFFFNPKNYIYINHCEDCAQKIDKYTGEYIYFYISDIKDRKSTKYQRKKGILTQGREYLVKINGTKMFINAPYIAFYKDILIQTHIKKGDFLYKICIKVMRFYNFLYKKFQKLYIQKLKVNYIIKLYYKTHIERKVKNFKYSLKSKKHTYKAILLRKLKLKTNRCIQCKKYYL